MIGIQKKHLPFDGGKWGGTGEGLLGGGQDMDSGGTGGERMGNGKGTGGGLARGDGEEAGMRQGEDKEKTERRREGDGFCRRGGTD